MKRTDGRRRAKCPPLFRPRGRISVAMVRAIIAMFESTGSSNHSASKVTLPYVLHHCEVNRIPYQLTFFGSGYHIKKFSLNDYLKEQS
jgi:hypothetical protein